MIKSQISNPFLPFNEYIPDGEPHIFGDRVYLYGSHDIENGELYCPLDYVCYSASIYDLKNWKYEGVIYKKVDEPANPDGKMFLYAPDVCQGPDGRFYLYYVATGLEKFSVAVCNEPAGEYKFYGYVEYPDGTPLSENWPFDPAVINDNGDVYLYYGFSPTNLQWEGMPDKKSILGGSVVKLDKNMVTVLEAPKIVIPSETHSQGTGFEGHEYYEGPSIRKIGDIFYLVYSSVLSHELCYATSQYPDRDFKYGGTIISNCNVGFNCIKESEMAIAAGNTHGGIVEVDNQWYVFYHRHTNNTSYSRQACAEAIEIEEDGSIKQVEITTSGLNGGPLSSKEPISAFTCCGLTNGKIPPIFKDDKTVHFPYVTKDSGNYIAKGLDNNSVITFKYIEIINSNSLRIFCRGNGNGELKANFIEKKSGNKVSFKKEISLTEEFTPIDIDIEVFSGVYTVEVEFFGAGIMDIHYLEFNN